VLLQLSESATGLKAMLMATLAVGGRPRDDASSEAPLALSFRIYETALVILERVLSVGQICASGKRIAKYLSKNDSDSESDTD